jgi:hypothetical protein
MHVVIKMWSIYNLALRRTSVINLSDTSKRHGPSDRDRCWIYNYMCNQCISSLKLCVLIPLMVGCTRYNIMWKRFQWLATSRWFSLGTLVFSINKTDFQDITEMLLKVALNTINQPIKASKVQIYCLTFNKRRNG